LLQAFTAQTCLSYIFWQYFYPTNNNDAGQQMSRFVTSINVLLLILALMLTGLSISRAQSLDLVFEGEIPTNYYATYRVVNDTRLHPGIGLRYTIEQDWFVFGEAHHARQVRLTQEPRLFQPDEPRMILIGGGIYF
jgi:hypothetical protein